MNTAYKNSKIQFGVIAKFFHWFSALSIIFLIILGFFMGDITQSSNWHFIAKNSHQLLGIFFFIMICLRSIWYLINIQPKIPGKPSKLEQISAKLGHIALYLLMLILPLTGWVMSSAQGLSSKFPTIGNFYLVLPGIPYSRELTMLAHQYHTVFAWLTIVLSCIHIIAALKHHYINKDFVLRRMLPYRNKKTILNRL